MSRAMNHSTQRNNLGICLSLLLVACGPAGGVAAGGLDAGIAPYLVPTAMEVALADAGIDLTTRPALNQLSPPQLKAVMVTFNQTLGTQCLDCHVKGAFKEATPRKQIAARMWSDWVNGLSLRGGGTLYCDSCHQGKLTLIDRADAKATTKLMNHLSTELVSREGKVQTCNSCHGAEFDNDFLSKWTQPI
jgi:hypothetical protein